MYLSQMASMFLLAQSTRPHEWIDPKKSSQAAATKFVMAMATLSTLECGFDTEVMMPMVDTSRYEDSEKTNALMADLWSVCGIDSKQYPKNSSKAWGVMQGIMRNACVATAFCDWINGEGGVAISDRNGEIIQIVGPKIMDFVPPPSFTFVCGDRAMVIVDCEASTVYLFFQIEGRFVEVDTYDKFQKLRGVTAGNNKSVWISDDNLYGITEFTIAGVGRNARLRRSRFVPIEALPIKIRGNSKVPCSIPRWSFHVDTMKIELADDLGIQNIPDLDSIPISNSDTGPADIRIKCQVCGKKQHHLYEPPGHENASCNVAFSRHGREPQLPPLSVNYAAITFGPIRFIPGTGNSVVAADWTTPVTIHDDIDVGVHCDLSTISIAPTGRFFMLPYCTGCHHCKSWPFRSVSVVL